MKPQKIPEPKLLFVERMRKLLGKDLENYLDILKIYPVKSIRTNTIKITPKKLKQRLGKKGWIITQPWRNHPEVMIIEGKINQTQKATNKSNNFKIKLRADGREGGDATAKSKNPKNPNVVDLEPGELGRALEHVLGYYYIQELASMLPIIALNPKPNEKLLDLCAAPGSKTTQAASMMQNSGEIIANEVSLDRIKILATNLERCGAASTIITRKDGIALCKRLEKIDKKFDKILIDAPCSGEGTLRSTKKTYLMWNPKTIFSLSKLQKQLVEAAIPLLKKGGELLYSTCTHAPEENEEVVDYILKNFPELKIQKLNVPVKTRPGISTWEEKKFQKNIKHACRVYPQDNDTEGFFIAKFKKLK